MKIRKIMHKVYLTALFLFCLVQNKGMLHAQAKPDEKMLSGTAVGSGLGEIYSPNLFDGTTNVQVPIYQFNKDGAEYGISLSYNTKGVKVDEISGLVGLHWNLGNLPSVTRVVKDLPDEINARADAFLQRWDTPNDFDSIENKEVYFKGKLASYLETPQQLAAANAVHDGESDEFIVNLGNGSFSFYFGKDFNVFTVPERRVKVQMKVNGVAITHFGELYFPFNSLLNFDFDLEVRDENGTVFYFHPEIREKYRPQFSDWTITDNLAGHMNYTVKWGIKKIIFSDGQAINYNTQNYQFVYGNYSRHEFRTFLVRESPTSTYVTNFLGSSYKERTTNAYSLTSIDYPNGNKVSFVYDSLVGNEFGAFMIGEIKVANKANCIRYKLDLDSVNVDSVLFGHNKRWFLRSISMSSCDGGTVEPYYSFGYDATQLPPRLWNGQDLYGYANKDTAGMSNPSAGSWNTVPKQASPLNGVERKYNLAYAKAGILNKVTNAYGGYVRFYYGKGPVLRNAYSHYLPLSSGSFVSDTSMDGLVVDSVKMFDPYYGPGGILTTKYAYGEGKVFFPGGFFHYPEHIDSVTGTWTTIMIQSAFLTAHQMVNGSNHGFSLVTVSEHDGSGALLSKKEIRFTNASDDLAASRYFFLPGSKSFFEYPYTDKLYLKDWEVGLPLKISQYDQNNRIVAETYNEYDFASPVDLSAASMVANTKTVKVETGTVTDYSGEYTNKKVFTDNYYPVRGKAPLKSSVTRKYHTDGLFISDTVTYKYDGRNNLCQTVTSDSRYGKTATNTVYNYNVDGLLTGSGALYDDPNSPLYKMTVAGIEKVVGIERWKLVPGSNGENNNDKLMDAFITRYGYASGRVSTTGLFNLRGANPTRYQYRSNGQAYPILPPYRQAKKVYLGQIPEPFQLTSEVTLPDAKNNPMESRMMGLELYKSMVWDTLTGQKTAEVNCRHKDMAYASFEEAVTPAGGLIAQGNFSYSASSVLAANAVTGKLAYWLTSDQGTTAGRLKGTQQLQAGKAYIFSFWLVGGGPLPSLYVGAVNLPLGEAVYQSGNKKNYQVRFTPQSAGILKLEARPGYPVALDEARLYPSDAGMSSQTYEPMFGVSSSTDASGRVTYYEYDKMGRQSTVRDMEGNILSNTEYHINQ